MTEDCGISGDAKMDISAPSITFKGGELTSRTLSVFTATLATTMGKHH